MDTERVDRAYTWHNANDNDWSESALESNMMLKPRILINLEYVPETGFLGEYNKKSMIL